MSFTSRVFASLLVVALVHTSLSADRGMAELWVCPGPDGTEAFSDSGGPGCHKANDFRPVARLASPLDPKRLEYAKNVIRESGDKIPDRIQRDILAQRVTLGMPPYEASLAAGAYTFKVTADPAKWPKNADPYKVIQAQTLHPDSSEIWMTFQTATQFPEKGMTRFVVYFRHGKAVEITELVIDPEMKWFVDLLQTHNGKTFCAPPSQTIGDTARAFANYMRSNQLPNRVNDEQTIRALVHLYPCVGGQAIGSAQLGRTGVTRVEVASAGEYASINMQPMIDLMKRLQRTAGHENDALMAAIEQHPGNYIPPVLMALGVAHFRQGHTEEAMFWFNAGRLRAMYDAARCADVSARSAVNALIYGTPRGLILAQFADPARFRDTAAKVIAWDETTPQNYEYRWINFHGMGAINSALGNTNGAATPLTVSQDQWSALAKQTREHFRSGVDKAIEEYQKQKESAATQAKR